MTSTTGSGGARPASAEGSGTAAADPSLGSEASEQAATTTATGAPATTLSEVMIRVNAIPGTKARDVVKVAVLPLNAASPSVTLELTIRAEGGLAGIPREKLNLVVLEGLRQLGLTDVHVEEG
jgi:hypothetical protein